MPSKALVVGANILVRAVLGKRMREVIERYAEQVPERLRRSHEVMAGIDDIDARQLVAVPFEDSLDGEPAHLQAEPGVSFEEVARCTAERARIGAARVGKFKGKIEESGVFRSGEPRPGSPLDVARSKRVFQDAPWRL